MSEMLSTARMGGNIEQIRYRMAQAAKEAGRLPQDVLLCAACKSRSAETVRKSAMLGVDLFGENRMQELTAHSDAGAYLGKPSHFIGHLQTNKIKKVVGRVSMIQSVDSMRLLEAINREAAAQNICQDILFQINLADELSKDGAARDDLWPMLASAAGMGNVRIKGLMAILPASEISLDSRQYFAMLRQLLEAARAYGYENAPLDTLSMGMTDSFEAAILEGATIIRVGTGIYGVR